MKKGIQYICLLLALLLLCGCAEEPIVTTKPSGSGGAINHSQTSVELSGEKYSFSVQQIPKDLDNPDGLPVLKWVCLLELGAGGPYHPLNETAMVQVNEMLAQQEQPFRLQLVLVMHDVSSNYWDWFNVPEVKEALQGADLIFGRLRSSEMKEYLMPITAYAKGEAQPSLKDAVPFDHLWNSTSVGDEIYGILGYGFAVSEQLGWTMDKDFMDQMGLTEKDFLGKEFQSMDDLFALIYERNGNQPFIYDSGRKGTGMGGTFVFTDGAAQTCYPGTLSQLVTGRFTPIGGLYAIDYGLEEPEVVNILECQYFRDYLNALRRYWDAGYVTTTSAMQRISYGSVRINYAYEYENNGSVNVSIPATESYLQPTKGSNFVSGVAAKSKHPQEALALLALLVEDEALRMQLFYGREGQDYQITEDGYYENIRQEDGTRYHMDALFCISRYSGMTMNSATADNALIYMPSVRINAPYLNGAENKTLFDTDKNSIEGSVHKYPYSNDYADRLADSSVLAFDFSSVEKEVRAMYEVCGRYYWYFTNPREVEDNPKTKEDEHVPEMTQERYNQMLQELRDTGSDKVLAELQRQFDNWKADNKK